MQQEPTEVTRLLLSWSRGDDSALNKLIPLVYRELRRIAAVYLTGEREDHTLQPTALVHEAYLRLAHDKRAACDNRVQFIAVAARLMRQILVNHAERRRAAKRGGGNIVTMDEASATTSPTVDLVALDEALNRLSELDARQSQIVELRFFGGLNEAEIAAVLHLSTATIKRDWRLARIMLHQHLGERILDPNWQVTLE